MLGDYAWSFIRILKMVYTADDWDKIADKIFKEKDVQEVRLIVRKFDNSEFEVRLSKPLNST